MTAIDFLLSPAGQELVHLLILVVNLVVVLLVRQSSHRSSVIERRLDVYVKSLMSQIHGGHEHRD